MRPGQRARQADQQSLWRRYERNMDSITDFFVTHDGNDQRELVPLLLDLFYDVNPALRHDTEELLGYTTEDKLKHALEFAIKRHEGHYLDSGAHYVSHPVRAGYLVAEFGFDEETVVSAILHDVVEENEDRALEELDNIRIWFGERVRDYVVSLSIFERGERRDDLQAAKLRGAFDLNLLCIKEADVIDNLLTKGTMKPKNGMSSLERQVKYSRNAEQNFLPFAHVIDQSGMLELDMTPYVRDLIGR